MTGSRSIRGLGAGRVGRGVGGLGEHVYGEAGFGAGDALVAGAAVGHGQQAADAAGDGVLGQRRVGELAQFFQAGLPVGHPQLARHGQVLGRLLAEDLQGALHARAGRHRGARAAAQVRVVEVRQPVSRGPDLAALREALRGIQPGFLRAAIVRWCDPGLLQQIARNLLRFLGAAL